MTELKIKTRARKLSDSIYVEYYPSNPEIQNIAFFGKEFPADYSIESCASLYLEEARQELLNILNGKFGEGSYT